MAKLNEAGARNSAADMKSIQAIHDHSTGLGADCAAKAAEALREAAVLRQSDSFASKQACLYSAIRAKFATDPSIAWNGDGYCSTPGPYIRDLFDASVIVSIGDDLYAVPYTIADVNGDMVATLGQSAEVECAYVPSGEQELPDENIEALRTLMNGQKGVLLHERVKAVAEAFTAGDKATIKKGAGKGKQVTIIGKSKVTDGHFSHKDANGNLGSTHGDDLAMADKPAKESDVTFTGDLIPLVERAVAADGTVPLKIVDPGWGSSGFYSADVLKRDGPKIFTAGMKMYADHPTVDEEAARPERSIRDLMAEFTEDAKWQDNGSSGPGLYTRAKVLDSWRPFVEQAAPHIGVSIRAMGRANPGEAEGKRGPIIERLVAAKSVDFVTTAGRGGTILQLQESLRATPPGESPIPAAESRNLNEERNMTEQEATQLREAAAVSKAETEKLKTDLARLKERNLVADASAFATRKLTESCLPDVTKKRLTESLAKNPPATDKGELDTAKFTTQIEATVKEEAAYLAEAAGSGQVRNLGSAPAAQTTEVDVSKMLVESFTRMGMSPAAANVAAQGRAS